MKDTNTFTNLYEMLGISRDADDKTIDKKLGRLLHRYHPDRNPNNIKAAEKFTQYSDWRDTLRDVEKRKEYDTKLRRQEAAQRGELNKLLPRERLITGSGLWGPAAMVNNENVLGLQRNRAFRAKRGEYQTYDMQIQTHRPPAVERSNAVRRAEKTQQILDITDREYESQAEKRGQFQYSFMIGDDRSYMNEVEQKPRLDQVNEY